MPDFMACNNRSNIYNVSTSSFNLNLWAHLFHVRVLDVQGSGQDISRCKDCNVSAPLKSAHINCISMWVCVCVEVLVIDIRAETFGILPTMTRALTIRTLYLLILNIRVTHKATNHISTTLTNQHVHVHKIIN